nr:3'-5' exonuclease [Azoarcus sp. L1K30]
MPGRDEARPSNTATRALIEQWAAIPDVDPNKPHFETRYVVVNTEASGLDLERDTLLSVAAIAIVEGQILPSDSYYATLGDHAAAALGGLVEFAGKSPLVVFSAEFNRTLIERAFEAHLGFTPELIWLDLYVLLPALFPDRLARPARLAEWMEVFGIETFQRHHALGDAWVIAQLMLAIQARALPQGAFNARLLADIERSRRQLQRQT